MAQSSAVWRRNRANNVYTNGVARLRIAFIATVNQTDLDNARLTPSPLCKGQVCAVNSVTTAANFLTSFLLSPSPSSRGRVIDSWIFLLRVSFLLRKEQVSRRITSFSASRFWKLRRPKPWIGSPLIRFRFTIASRFNRLIKRQNRRSNCYIGFEARRDLPKLLLRNLRARVKSLSLPIRYSFHPRVQRSV